MKPRTKLEKQVAGLSARLPEVTDKQKRWMMDHCFQRKGYLRKKTVWCTECGHTWEAEESELVTQICGVECPHCHRKMEVERSRKRKSLEEEYGTIVTVCGGFQLLRHLFVTRYCSVGKAAVYSLDEVIQNWITPDGRDTTMARDDNMNIFGATWRMNTGMSIKRHRFSQTTYVDTYDYKYNINEGHIYPRKFVIPELRRNGFEGEFHDVEPLVLFRSLLSDSHAETLIKAKQYALLKEACRDVNRVRMDWASIKICIRNGYTVEDAGIWRDYLSFLRYFGKDMSNAKYVCPEDLKAEHDRWMKRKDRAEEKRKEEDRRKEAEDAELEYRKMKGKLLDVCFGDGMIRVGVLQSVRDFFEEGKIMHHCVFSNEYYKRRESLILSARIGEKRIETVEVNIDTLEVVQSRGVCNQNSKYHGRIVELVRKNLGLIRNKLM